MILTTCLLTAQRKQQSLSEIQSEEGDYKIYKNLYESVPDLKETIEHGVKRTDKEQKEFEAELNKIVAQDKLAELQKKYHSDPTSQNLVNKYSTGNISEDGVNASKIIAKKLQKINEEIKNNKNPEGWEELLKEADALIQNYKVAEQKQDSIQNQLEIQKQAVLLEQQKTNVFKNQMLGLLIGLISVVFVFFIIRWIVREAKKKSYGKSINMVLPTRRFKNLNQKETLFFSIILSLIISIVSGSLFTKTKYLKLYKGQSVEVSKSISTFELQEFNYLLCIVVFLVSVGLLYGTWHFNNQNTKS